MDNDRNLDIRTALTRSHQNATESNYGYILIDNSFEILFSNDFSRQIFKGLERDRIKNSIDLFKDANASVLRLANIKLIDCSALLKVNNNIIETVYSAVNNDGVLVSLVYFALYKKEVLSLLVNFIPVCDPSGKVIFIQIFISPYDYWGTADIFNLYDRKEEPIKIMNSLNRPQLKLTQRQEEVAFLISLGIGLRQAAQLLQISYGSLASTVREALCHKFDVPSSNTELLIEKLASLGYNRLVPQSLCIPKTIILDSQIRLKYFTEIYS